MSGSSLSRLKSLYFGAFCGSTCYTPRNFLGVLDHLALLATRNAKSAAFTGMVRRSSNHFGFSIVITRHGGEKVFQIRGMANGGGVLWLFRVSTLLYIALINSGFSWTL